MMRLILTIAALLTIPMALAAEPTPPPPDASIAALFPPGPGHDTLLRICSTCHSPAVAAQQRLSPAAWKELVAQMVGFGAPGTDAELAEITDYLAKSFPAEPSR